MKMHVFEHFSPLKIAGALHLPHLWIWMMQLLVKSVCYCIVCVCLSVFERNCIGWWKTTRCIRRSTWPLSRPTPSVSRSGRCTWPRTQSMACWALTRIRRPRLMMTFTTTLIYLTQLEQTRSPHTWLLQVGFSTLLYSDLWLSDKPLDGALKP